MGMKKLRPVSILAVMLAVAALGSMARAMVGDRYAYETAAQRDERMAWWRVA